MRTALTSEVAIHHNGVKYLVDGYIETATKKYIFEYRGCR